MIHELGHVLGLGHEHKRPDRDTYVTINWSEMVIDGMDWTSQYTMDENYDTARPYNYNSIMQCVAASRSGGLWVLCCPSPPPVTRDLEAPPGSSETRPRRATKAGRGRQRGFVRSRDEAVSQQQLGVVQLVVHVQHLIPQGAYRR